MAEGGENGAQKILAKEEAKERLRKVLELREERNAYVERLVHQLSEDRVKELLYKMADEKPGLMHDLLAKRTKENGPPEPEEPKPSWCKCGNCKEMGVMKANFCCGKDPDECVAKCAEVEQLCLDPSVVSISDTMYKSMTAGVDGESGSRDMRHASYRQFLMWRYGTIDGMRSGPFDNHAQVKIYSCVVWRIRNLFPDPSGRYQGWMD